MPGHFTFYTQKIEKEQAFFDDSEFGHAIRTLRFELNDAIQFTDGNGTFFSGRINHIGKNWFSADIIKRSAGEEQNGLSLFIGLLKSGDRMEWIVEKCTELGIGSLYFIKMNRSERNSASETKLRKTAISAIKQSHRSRIPEIRCVSWNEVFVLADQNRYVASLNENSVQIHEIPPAKSMSFIIGPEGDFTKEEMLRCEQEGFKPVTLGNSVLRTETASVAIAAVLNLGGILI